MGYCVKAGGLGLLLVLFLAGCGGGSSGTAQLTFSPNAPPPPTGATGVAYPAFTFAAPTGGAGPFTWSETGALPKGMSLSSSGRLSGTPTTSGSFPITLTVADSSNPGIAAKESVTLTIKNSPLVISTSPAPPPGTQGSAYPGFTFTAAGGSQPLTWSVSPGALPAGLALSTSGTLTGTPSGSGPSTFTLTARDSAPNQEVATQTFTINVVGQLTISITYLGSGSPPETFPAGTTAQFQGSITNDPANGGILWSLTYCTIAGDCATSQVPDACTVAICGSVSPATSANNATVTYTAPTVPPAGDILVTLTATAQTSPTTSTTNQFKIPAVTVVVLPVGALLPVGIAQTFAATIGQDPANAGVTWAAIQNDADCAPTCGTVAPLHTGSGTPTTYTAPGALPASPTVSLTATSVTEATSSGTGVITLTNGTVKLVPDDLTFVGCAGNAGVCAVATQDAELTNTGASALAISGITVSGTNAGDFTQTNSCGASLAPGVACALTIGYKSGSRGTHTATINIADNSPDSPQQLAVTGFNKASVKTGAVAAALRGRGAPFVPRPTGSSTVGTRVVHLVDSGRADPYLGGGARRELMVRFWYPRSGNECAPAEYASPGVVSEFSRLLGTAVPRIATNSCLNAPVAVGAHPIVVVTPGFTGTSTDYTFLAEDLASRGYVVAAVDHTYEAVAVEFPDGRLAKGVFGSSLTDYTRSDVSALTFAVSVRTADLRFVADQLTAMNGGNHGAFAGKLDTSHMALLGHSLGGLTALRGAQSDTRFRAAISLDGLVPNRLTPPTSTPVLLVRAGSSPWNDNDCQLWGALKGGRVTVNLTGAEHTALSDAAWLAPGAAATGPMGVDATVRAIREVTAEFLNEAFTGSTETGSAVRALMNDRNAVVTLGDQSRCGQTQ